MTTGAAWVSADLVTVLVLLAVAAVLGIAYVITKPRDEQPDALDASRDERPTPQDDVPISMRYADFADSGHDPARPAYDDPGQLL